MYRHWPQRPPRTQNVGLAFFLLLLLHVPRPILLHPHPLSLPQTSWSCRLSSQPTTPSRPSTGTASRAPQKSLLLDPDSRPSVTSPNNSLGPPTPTRPVHPGNSSRRLFRVPSVGSCRPLTCASLRPASLARSLGCWNIARQSRGSLARPPPLRPIPALVPKPPPPVLPECTLSHTPVCIPHRLHARQRHPVPSPLARRPPRSPIFCSRLPPKIPNALAIVALTHRAHQIPSSALP